jgi:hypothetical protein
LAFWLNITPKNIWFCPTIAIVVYSVPFCSLYSFVSCAVLCLMPFLPYPCAVLSLCHFVRCAVLCVCCYVLPVWYLSERVVAVGRLPVVPVLINSYPQGLFLQTSGYLQDRSFQTSGYLQDMPQQKTPRPVMPAFIHRQQAVCEACPCWQPATSGPGSYSPRTGYL